MKDFIPVGIGIQTSGPDSDKHQLLKISFVSFHSGARISATLKHATVVVDVNHCKDFLSEIGEEKGPDIDVVDETLASFLQKESKILFEDQPGTKIMQMAPTGVSINRTMEFIKKELPNTYSSFDASLELYSVLMMESLKAGGIDYLQESTKPIEEDGSTLAEAYSYCYQVAEFSHSYPDWMRS